MLTETNITKMLLCYDVDQSIVIGHLHNYLSDREITRDIFLSMDTLDRQSVLDQFLEETGGFNHGPETLGLLRQALQAGHPVALTTYSSFREILPMLLKSLGLEEVEINKIEIVSGFPTVDKSLTLNHNNPPAILYGKNLHIVEAMNRFGIDLKSKNCLLLDDNIWNTSKATQSGYAAIQILAENNFHFCTARNFLGLSHPDPQSEDGDLSIREISESNLEAMFQSSLSDSEAPTLSSDFRLTPGSSPILYGFGLVLSSDEDGATCDLLATSGKISRFTKELP